MFDPHATHLPGATPARPGSRLLVCGVAAVVAISDQFAGYLGTFGCDLTRPYPATMFRFPLRSENAAKASEIKPEAYTADDVRRLFEQFRPRAAQTLLFLKNVRKISVYERGGETDAGDGSDEPRLLCEASIPTLEDGNDPRADRASMGGGRGGRLSRREAPRVFRSIARRPGGVLPVLRGLDGPHCPPLLPKLEDATPTPHRTRRHVRATAEISVWVVSALRVHRERWMVCSIVSRRRARALAPRTSDAARSRPVGRRRALVPHPDEAVRSASSPEIDGRAFVLRLAARTGSPRARQRVRRTEQQPPRHLVRRGHGRAARRGASGIERCWSTRSPRTSAAAPTSAVALGSVPEAYYARYSPGYVRGGTVVARASCPVRIARAS